MKKYYILIKQTKFTYSPLGKSLGKQTKTIQNQFKKQIKAIKDHRKQLVESNKLNINRDSIPLEGQKKYLINLLNEGLLNFGTQKK